MWRNMSQIKEWNKTSEEELNKRETKNPPDAEFRTLFIRVLNELRRRVHELSENFTNHTGNKKSQK